MEAEDAYMKNLIEEEFKESIRNIKVIQKIDFCLSSDNAILLLGGPQAAEPLPTSAPSPKKNSKKMDMSVIQETIEELTFD